MDSTVVIECDDDGPGLRAAQQGGSHDEEKKMALERIDETLRKLDEMRAKELGQQSTLDRKLAKRKTKATATSAKTWSKGTGYGGSEMEGKSKEAERFRRMVQASHNTTDEAWAAAFHHIAEGNCPRPDSRESRIPHVLHARIHPRPHANLCLFSHPTKPFDTRSVAPVKTSPSPGPRRLTATPPLLQTSKRPTPTPTRRVPCWNPGTGLMCFHMHLFLLSDADVPPLQRGAVACCPHAPYLGGHA